MCVQSEGKIDESPACVVGGPQYFFYLDHGYRAYLSMNYRSWEDAGGATRGVRNDVRSGDGRVGPGAAGDPRPATYSFSMPRFSRYSGMVVIGGRSISRMSISTVS